MNSVFIFYTSYDAILQELNKCESLKGYEKYKILIARCFDDKSQYGIDEGSVNYLVGVYCNFFLNHDFIKRDFFTKLKYQKFERDKILLIVKKNIKKYNIYKIPVR